MKVISIWQPWATLMAAGYKRIETRSWPPHGLKPGQLVAIHAGKRWTGVQRAICDGEPFKRCLVQAHQRGLWDAAHPPLGCVVAIARFDHFAATSGGIDYEQMTDEEHHFGNYSGGRFGWFFSEVRPVEPIPLRGQQGLFEWSPPAELPYLGPRDAV